MYWFSVLSLLLLLFVGEANAQCVGVYPFQDNCPLSAAGLNAALTPVHVPNNAALQAASVATYVSVIRDDFSAGLGAPPLQYKGSNFACPLNAGAGDGGSQVPSSDSKCWLANFPASGADVLQFGADPTGVADSGPAFRAALAVGSIRTVIVPAGTYLFTTTQPAPYNVFDPPHVLVQSRDNLTVIAYGAKFQAQNAVALSSIFEFDKTNNIHWYGGEFVGNRTGSVENSGFGLSNMVNFSFDNIRFTGNWGGTQAMFYGDWLVNGTFNNIVGDAIGICVDFAFLKDVSLTNIRAVGADLNGVQTAGHVGNKCYSNVFDGAGTPAQNTLNVTGVSYTDTDGITISGFDASNFATGFDIESGNHYSLLGNRWHDNPGISGVARGLGGFINYTPNGNFSSVGHPPGNIAIKGDQFYNNGTVQAGNGIFIVTSTIANGDVISNISVDALFDNNTNTGIEADSSSHLLRVEADGVFSGANQTVAIGPNIFNLPASASISVTKVSSVGGKQLFGSNVLTNSHLISHGAVPTNPTGCGVAPVINGGSGDLAGAITLGTAPGGTCTITFAGTYGNKPVCFARDETTGINLNTQESLSQLIMAGALSAGDIIKWMCVGYE